MSGTDIEIVDALRAFLAKKATLPHALEQAESPAGFDRRLLQHLAELGFFEVASTSEVGGLGCSPGLMGSCCAEAGRVLLGGPWFEQLLTVRLLEGAGRSDLLDEVIVGSVLYSLPLASTSWLRPPVVALEDGRARFAAASSELGFAAGVDAWLVPAHDAATGAIVLVRLAPDPARVSRRRGFSVLWPAFDALLDDASGEVVAEIDDRLVATHLLDTARMLACVSVGATETVLARATEYAKQREQFGRPIGSFQSLQHRLADVFIDLEHTRSLVTATWDPAPFERRQLLSAMAKVASDRLSVMAAETAVQVHGGAGFTWELPVHHFLKEALRRRTLPESTGWYRLWLRNSVMNYNL